MEKAKVYLTLQNGKTFVGYRFGAKGDTVGEIVFTTTGITGYLGTLTDPCNFGQIVAHAFPAIGNFGIVSEHAESNKNWLSAYIVREKCDSPSNFRCEGKLEDYLKEHNIIGIYGIDTRELTKNIREFGVMNAAITSKPLKDLSLLNNYKIENAVKAVTCEKIEYLGNPEGEKVAVWDFGVKASVVNALVSRNLCVIKVPASYTAEEILDLGVKGVVLSDGPGNPAENNGIVEEIKKLCGKLPIFGIGLGHQLFALAMGGKTQKMKVGHRGGNQPVKEIATGKVYITSQNHGYEVVSSSIEKVGEVTFVNVNDNSCEGCKYESVNAVTVQFYPGVCCDARDTTILYDNFVKEIKEVK
ncbi:MAG: glutamine-hydrolyzing carbamoyl-phosphate synthase small subunit [Clostridiales bacterium]|nr:glutamine-hydrolyzing carbamoyl-phosphate synthase small subunit [Clostridiales bacterium]